MPATDVKKISVLVVDDSQTVRVAATRILSDEFEVVLAVDGAKGLAAIEQDPCIQVVFTDLVMPEMDGFELLKAIRTHTDQRINNLPVIVTTGAENPEIAKQKALSVGATDFIVKPFAKTEILTRARSYAQLNQVTKKLEKQTTIDVLTGLFNQRGFFKQLEKEISFVTRHQYSISVLSIEIDNYKSLFVDMGRAQAEAIIGRVATAIGVAQRKEDNLARIGIAKFAISMPLSNEQNALEMANKICRLIESLRVTFKGKRLTLTVSAGAFNKQPDDGTIKPVQLLSTANTALKKAKALGASQIYLFSIEDYRKQAYEQACKEISIDALLEQINSGEPIKIAYRLEAALKRLAPLIAVLSNEQKHELLNF